MSLYNFEESMPSDRKKAEQILSEHFPPKGNTNLRGRILEYGDALLEWAAQQAEQCLQNVPQDTGAGPSYWQNSDFAAMTATRAATLIRAGKSEQ